MYWVSVTAHPSSPCLTTSPPFCPAFCFTNRTKSRALHAVASRTDVSTFCIANMSAAADNCSSRSQLRMRYVSYFFPRILRRWRHALRHGPSSTILGAVGRDALERKGPQKRLGRRLEEVAKAVGGGYCRLQMPFKLALAVRETVPGRWQGALEGGRGGVTLPPPPLPVHPWWWVSVARSGELCEIARMLQTCR